MAKLIAGTYGDALFELAVEQNLTDSLMQEIDFLQTVLKENSDFEKILMHPEIPKQKKLQLIENVFKGRISDALTGFLRIVVTKGRYENLPDIFAYFIARVKEYKKNRNCPGGIGDSASGRAEAENRTEASGDDPL